jgi:hypothetical protein
MKKNMDLHFKLLVVTVLLGGVPAGELMAADPAPKNTPVTATPAPPVKFRPSGQASAAVRVTGGSRGSGDSAVTLDVLAPDEVGTTTQEQPSLFWFQSGPSKAKFELTLIQENKAKPIVQVDFDQASKAGIQRVKLSDHGGKLAVGVEYQWVVALVNDADNRSKDLVASGVIKRIDPSADLKRKIASTSPSSLPGVYADAGIWYDALSTLSDQIETHPDNKGLRHTRGDLLQQVGLKAAARADLLE